MKKIIMMFVVAAFLATPALAQKKDHTEWDNKVKTELKLTDDQITKYDALSKEYEGKMETLKQDATLSKDAMKEKKMAMKKEKEAKMAEFLTAEQQTKYREMVEKKKKEMGNSPRS